MLSNQKGVLALPLLETVDPGTPEEEWLVVFHWAFASGKKESNGRDRLANVRCMVKMKVVMRDSNSDLVFLGRHRYICTRKRIRARTRFCSHGACYSQEITVPRWSRKGVSMDGPYR